MSHQSLRNVSRRLVTELTIVVLLAGAPIDFPMGVSAGGAWGFIGQHPSLLLHVVVGSLILTEGIAFLIRSIPGSGRRPLLLSGVGLAFIVLAFGSGLVYTGAGQHESALTFMTTGWIGAIVTYGVAWWLGHRALAA